MSHDDLAARLEHSVEWLLGTGEHDLDELLGGGIRPGVVTELVGESASGKTQISLQLAVHTVLGPPAVDSSPPGSTAVGADSSLFTPRRLRGGIVLLTSEGEAVARAKVWRLMGIAEHEVRRRFLGGMASEGMEDTDGRDALDVRRGLDEVLQNVHVTPVADLDTLEHILLYHLPAAISRFAVPSASTQAPGPDAPQSMPSSSQPRSLPIRLVILDSLASLFRPTFEGSMPSMIQRSRVLSDVGDRLKRLAVMGDSIGLAIVVVNQVTDVFERETKLHTAPPSPGGLSSTAREPSCTDTMYSRSLQHTPAMAFAVQSPFFSGQMASEASGAPGRAKVASLGLVWANCVNVRLMLSRTSHRVPLERLGLSSMEGGREGSARPEVDTTCLVRRVSLVFSPFSPSDRSIDMVILSSGVRAVPDTLRYLIPPRPPVRLMAGLNEQTSNTGAIIEAPAPLSFEEWEEGEEEEDDMFFELLEDSVSV